VGTPPISYLVEILEFLGSVPDLTQPGSSWRHVQMVFTNTVTADNADNAVVTFDIANITGGVLDDTWTAADYSTVDGELGKLATIWGTYMSGYGAVKEFRYYRRAFNPYSDPKPFAIGGPPEHVHPFPVAGSSTQYGSPQTAFTHTEKTAYPRHWGRAYWPFLGSTQIAPSGHFVNAYVDSLATAIQGVYHELMAAEFFPCVPTTQALKVPSRNLLGVSSIQVDNVIDVIRSRRLHQTTYKKELSV
jgi:hypothetical protein